MTILRDPVDQFESMYNYVHFEKEFKTDLEGFVKKYVKGRRPVKKRVSGYLGQNQQLCDLGMDINLLNDDKAVKNKIMKLDKDFNLVMLAEEFDESMVLLSDLLCLPLTNMTSLKINARKKSAKSSMTNETRQALREWLWSDQMLYEHFRDVFQIKKSIYGLDKLKAKTEELSRLNFQLKERCVIKKIENTRDLDKLYKPWSKDVTAFKINETDEDCKFFGISENNFVDYLRTAQLQRWRKWRDANF